MVRPADNGRARRFTMDGTAMDTDADDLVALSYKKGREDQKRDDDAADAIEERRWRFAFAASLSLIIVALGFIAHALASRLDAITGVIQSHSEATWQASQAHQAPSPPTRDR